MTRPTPWNFTPSTPTVTPSIFREINEFDVEVESTSRPGRWHHCYPVSYPTRDGWFCPCESYRYSTNAGCKHTAELANRYVPEVKVIGYKRRT